MQCLHVIGAVEGGGFESLVLSHWFVPVSAVEEGSWERVVGSEGVLLGLEALGRYESVPADAGSAGEGIGFGGGGKGGGKGGGLGSLFGGGGAGEFATPLGAATGLHPSDLPESVEEGVVVALSSGKEGGGDGERGRKVESAVDGVLGLAREVLHEKRARDAVLEACGVSGDDGGGAEGEVESFVLEGRTMAAIILGSGAGEVLVLATGQPHTDLVTTASELIRAAHLLSATCNHRISKLTTDPSFLGKAIVALDEAFAAGTHLHDDTHNILAAGKLKGLWSE